jgi:hypothetical protein
MENIKAIPPPMRMIKKSEMERMMNRLIKGGQLFCSFPAIPLKMYFAFLYNNYPSRRRI